MAKVTPPPMCIRTERCEAAIHYPDCPKSRPHHSYGHDETDNFETLAEATLNEDGTIHMEVVVMEKDD